jgi:hypothetical protein
MPEMFFQPSREDRPRLVGCRFCPSNVDREPVAAARHIMFACRNPSAEAVETARAVLASHPEVAT